MKILKKNLITKDQSNSDQYIEDNLTFAGYDKNSKLVRIIIVKCEEVLKKKSAVLQTKEVRLDRLELPSNFSIVDAIRTISYVLNQVSKKVNEDVSSILCPQLAHHCLPQYHFKQIPDTERKKAHCVNLFVVSGAPDIFDQTEYFYDYFDWYQKDVTRDQIQNIYKKAGLTLPRTTKINFEQDEEEPNA